MGSMMMAMDVDRSRRSTVWVEMTLSEARPLDWGSIWHRIRRIAHARTLCNCQGFDIGMNRRGAEQVTRLG
jgi:hypothetical protein